MLYRKCELEQVCKSNKKDVSNRSIKALHFATVKRIVAKFMAKKRDMEEKEIRTQASIFGVPMKWLMSDDLAEHIKGCPAVQEAVDSFKKRYEYKSKEQQLRAKGRNAYEDEAKQADSQL